MAQLSNHEANVEPFRIENARPGDLIVLPITGAWYDATEEGIAGGFLIYPEAEGLVHFSDQYDLVPDEAGGLKRTYKTKDCFTMRVSYVLPSEDDS